MKPIFLSIFLLIFNTKGNSQSVDLYIDSIFNLIIENRLVVLDSNKSPIPNQTIINKYQHYDTIINCLWTRPKFINNIYHSSFDGVLMKSSRPDFDTSFYESVPEFISFTENIYDDNGNYSHKKWAFMIYRNVAPLSPYLIKKKIIKGIRPIKKLRPISKSIQTKENEIWVNKSFEINNSSYPIDSCMSKYYLQLNSNYTFEHHYLKDSFCITSSSFYEKTVGVEDDTELILKYAERVQYYKIENRTGYWNIKNSNLNDRFLIFYSKNGNQLAKYKLQVVSNNSIVLYINKQKISLRRVIQSK
jgi:hypothetical protein